MKRRDTLLLLPRLLHCYVASAYIFGSHYRPITQLASPAGFIVMLLCTDYGAIQLISRLAQVQYGRIFPSLKEMAKGREN